MAIVVNYESIRKTKNRPRFISRIYRLIGRFIAHVKCERCVKYMYVHTLSKILGNLLETSIKHTCVIYGACIIITISILINLSPVS